MPRDSHEEAGWIFRWLMLGLAAGIGVGVCALVMLGLRYSAAGGAGWAVAADDVTSDDRNILPPVYLLPPAGQRMPEMLGRRLGGPLRPCYVSRSGSAVLLLGRQSEPDVLEYQAIANPYGGHVIAGEMGRILVRPIHTESIVLDGRCCLPMNADGTLARHAATAGLTIPVEAMSRLGSTRPLIVLVTAPLTDYHPARRAIREAADAFVLPASTSFDRPADAEDFVATLQYIRTRLRGEPQVVTQDAELARAAVRAKRAVYFVGAWSGEPLDGCTVVKDWRDLAETLAVEPPGETQPQPAAASQPATRSGQP
jgi:hypothetical protein